MIAATALLVSVELASAQELFNEEVSMHSRGSWISALNSNERAVSGSIYLFKFKDPTYVVLKEISWQPNIGSSQQEAVVVPEGFVTDLASIPPVFFSFLRPDGEYAHAAIVHDFLYWSQQRSRSESDKVFRSAMRDLNVSEFKVGSIYRAVRWGGESAWRKNDELKKSGEKRFLSKFPQDPRATWAEWKADPDVFK